MIADRQVAFSDRDCWAYQSLFLEGWCLGCPPDYFSKDGQAWGFPVINPEKLYNEDYLFNATQFDSITPLYSLIIKTIKNLNRSD